MAPSLIFKLGKLGKKSFPTKKHKNTKSSMILSKSNLEVIKSLNSNCKYSLNSLL